MCLYPKLLDNPKYKPNKKNGGIPPQKPLRVVNGVTMIDKRVEKVAIGCGKCIECLKQKSNEWRVRLLEEIKHNKTKAHFVTLTFSNDSIKELTNSNRIWELQGYERDNAIASEAVRRFKERWRKKHGKQPRAWLITELGHQGTENIHLHGIIWTEHGEDITPTWKYGFTWNSSEQYRGWVNEQTVNYVIKYCTKLDTQREYYKPKIYASNGLGKDHFKHIDKQYDYKGDQTREFYKTSKGYKVGLPKYYRNKAFTEEEREKLWIHKLDKGIVYVMGNPIDLNKPGGEEHYYLALEHAQRQNQIWGYGSDKIDWEKKYYENRLRDQRNAERLQNLVDLGESGTETQGLLELLEP